MEKNKRHIQNYGISERVESIQMLNEDVNALILEYIPFIKSAIYKTTGNHITDESDEMSIGLLAFNEAIEKFDSSKGSFLSFANWVIKRRIIDYMRSQKINKNEINFTDLSKGQLSNIYNSLPTKQYMVDNPLKLEIEALSSQLECYDINFEDLVEVSPKAKKTKAMCMTVIEYLLDNPAIITKMRQSRRLPAKDFKENFNIPRKFLDRHRKYIITVVEILTGDYLYLKEYVAFIGKGERL